MPSLRPSSLRALRALTLALGLAAGTVGPPARATTPNAAAIDRLIARLGSPRFDERKRAAETLEAIGEPALDALTTAARGHADAEVRRRAGQLVATLEDRLCVEVRRFEVRERGFLC